MDANGEDAMSDADAIQALAQEWEAAVNSGSAERWLDVWTDDGIFMPPDTPAVKGKQEMLDWGKAAFFDVFDMHVDNSLADLQIAGDWACCRITGTFAGTPKSGGDTLNAVTKGLAVYRKQSDASWKYAQAVFNWDAPLGS